MNNAGYLPGYFGLLADFDDRVACFVESEETKGMRWPVLFIQV